MPNLLATYSADGPGHDEMLQAQGAAREAWDHLASAAGLRAWSNISSQRDKVVSLLADQGVRSGVDLAHPWRLDPLPVVLDSAEWRRIEAGLAQRARVLDAIFADLYGPRSLLLEGVLPAEIVLGNPGFIRAADGTKLAGDHHLFHTSAQLARNADGAWSVLSDSTDLLPGLGYAMADRRAVADVLTGAYRSISAHRLGPFFQLFRQRLDAIAPIPEDSPRVAMLVPGNRATTFDQAYLADTLAIPIVSPADLIVADGRLWLRTLGDVEPVDVLLRHLPSIESDPVDLTQAAVGGVPGLIETAHTGSVSVVNPIGAGVLENPALLTYLPRVCRHVLGEDLLLPSTVTYWCGERSMGSHVVANLERLVVISTATGHAVNGWELSISERADLATQISATPHLWVGQEPLEMSTAPSVGTHELLPLPTSIHTFAIADGDSYAVMPGGLGSTSPGPGPHRAADIAKDVWVLTGGSPVSMPEFAAMPNAGTVLAAGSAANLFEFGTRLERAEGVLRLARNQSTAPEDSEEPEQRVSMDDVAHALEALSQAAYGIRDHLTPEAWRALAALELPAPLAQHLVNLAALSGVIHESILHDRGRALMVLGRRLERARFLTSTATRALSQPGADVTEPVPGNSPGVVEFLRLHDSLLAFWRLNRFRAALPSLLELLLLSRTNPRSLAFCIDDVGRILGELPSHTAPEPPPQELVAELQATLAQVDLRDLAADHEQLIALLRDTADRVDQLAHAIREQQFGSLGTALWTAEAEGSDA